MRASVVLYVYISLPHFSSLTIDALKLGGQRDDRRSLQPFFRVLAQVLERFSGDVGVKGRFAGVLLRRVTNDGREREGEIIYGGEVGVSIGHFDFV
jgi:hypothetical protein